MATLFFGMNQSFDGFVDHEAFGPDRDLFRHFIQQTRSLSGSIYGRRLYELMSYWDIDDPDWTEAEQEFAEAWRNVPKWVVSTKLRDVGPNASLIREDAAGAVRELKQTMQGELEVGGTVLARHLAEWGLIDEYRIYLHPVVLGQGIRFFNGLTPKLALFSSQQIGDQAVLLTCVPADS